MSADFGQQPGRSTSTSTSTPGQPETQEKFGWTDEQFAELAG